MNHGIIFNITQYSFLSRPLGGHRIASFLREQGWDIEVVDWANWWTLEQLQEFFRSRYSQDLKFVGFGHLFSIWPEMMEQFAAWVKKNYPQVLLVSGSSSNPMFQSKYIDWYVQGFGENAILELLKYSTGNGTSPRFNLLGGRKIIPAIDYYPAFPMKSLMVRYEDRDFIQGAEWLTVELSRGCKFKCAFCQFPILGIKENTSRDAEDFEIQLKDTYDRFGITSYMIADETCNDRTEKISKFADVVERLDFQPWFSAYIRADLIAVHPEQKQELLRMNVLGQFYGIESMNAKTAKSVGKGMDPNRVKQCLIDTKNYFLSNGRRLYRGHIGLIAGLPFETEQSLNDAVSWIVDNWQGQSFGIHPLLLPKKDSVVKHSSISSDLLAYGYEEMTPEEISQGNPEHYAKIKKIQKKHEYTQVGEELYWKNENMNLFDAQRIIAEIYDIKKQHDFRPGNFMMNYRLIEPLDIVQRLALSFDQYDGSIDPNIENYINKKLG